MYCGIPLIVGMTVPTLVVAGLESYWHHVRFWTALITTLTDDFFGGKNLWFATASGLMPFAILAVLLNILATRVRDGGMCLILLMGLVCAVGLMIPAHISVWRPLYVGGRMSSTAVLAFLFIPIYSTMSLAIGSALGFTIHWLFGRWRGASSVKPKNNK